MSCNQLQKNQKQNYVGKLSSKLFFFYFMHPYIYLKLVTFLCTLFKPIMFFAYIVFMFNCDISIFFHSALA